MRKGFTVIELLIVLAIIVILSAMIIPRMIERRDESRKRFDENNHVAPVISSRFTVDSQGSLSGTSFGVSVDCMVITDKNSGKQYLIVDRCGIIELVPLLPEKAKEQQ